MFDVLLRENAVSVQAISMIATLQISEGHRSIMQDVKRIQHHEMEIQIASLDN